MIPIEDCLKIISKVFLRKYYLIGTIMLNIPEIITEEEKEQFFKKVADNVKKLRTETNMSQLEVALSIGQKSSGFYANMENYAHNKKFNLEHLLKLSKLFEVDVEEFFK